VNVGVGDGVAVGVGVTVGVEVGPVGVEVVVGVPADASGVALCARTGAVQTRISMATVSRPEINFAVRDNGARGRMVTSGTG